MKIVASIGFLDQEAEGANKGVLDAGLVVFFLPEAGAVSILEARLIRIDFAPAYLPKKSHAVLKMSEKVGENIKQRAAIFKFNKFLYLYRA